MLFLSGGGLLAPLFATAPPLRGAFDGCACARRSRANLQEDADRVATADGVLVRSMIVPPLVTVLRLDHRHAEAINLFNRLPYLPYKMGRAPRPGKIYGKSYARAGGECSPRACFVGLQLTVGLAVTRVPEAFPPVTKVR